MAWIIGWDLILEYAVSVAAVAVGWGQYFNDLLDSLFGITLPESLAAPARRGRHVQPAGRLHRARDHRDALHRHPRERALQHDHGRASSSRCWRSSSSSASPRSTRGNLKPFTPEGIDGVVTAASVIFFAYIGFDAVSTSGEETKNPGRDLPIAIIGSLAIATLLYIVVSVVAVGALPFDQLKGAEAPLPR